MHAMQRMDEMSLCRDDVVAVLSSPELTYRASDHHPSRWIAVCRALAVVYNSDERVVVTVLWHGRTGRDVAA